MGRVDEAEGRRILARQAAMAERVGAGKMTLHFGSYPGEDPCEETRAEALRRVVGLLGDFVPELERRELRAGVENFVACFSATTLGERVSDFELLFSEVASESIGFVLDTGHGNMTGDLAAYPEKFRERLMHTHLHDNDGSKDSHEVPGRGTIRWDGVLGRLAEMGYSGTLGLEFPEASGGYPAFIETLRMT